MLLQSRELGITFNAKKNRRYYHLMKNMAITSYDTSDRIRPDAPQYRPNGSASSRMIKHNYGTNSSTASTVSKKDKNFSKKCEPKSSPYLSGDTIQLSRVIEKRFIQKKTMDYTSSFPLAVNIYKTNSDELKSKKRMSKKIKKSVLTLPNEPTPEVQICTVSDVNDSEYYSRTNINRKPRLKRAMIKNVRKPQNKNIDFEFTVANSQCYSASNSINKSFTDLNKKHKDDGNTFCKRTNKHIKKSRLQSEIEADKNKDCIKVHDIWEILRNLNRFQFVPSPPMSDESVLVLKKNKIQNKDRNRKDTRVIETRRTEEFAYISSYEVDDSLHSLSQSTSFDRITVINNTHEFSNSVKNRFLKVRFPKNNTNCPENQKKIKKRRIRKRNLNNSLCPITSGQHTELDYNKHEINLNHLTDPEKNRSDCDDVSSFINVDDLQNRLCSEDNVCSDVKKHELKSNYDPVKQDISTESSMKIEITVNKRNAENKDVCRTKKLAKPNESRLGNRGMLNTNPVKARLIESQKPKSHVITAIPSARILPISNISDENSKHGNDQVSSSMVVAKVGSPQSDYWDKPIWFDNKNSDENIKLKFDENLIKNQKRKDNFIRANRKKYDNCYKDIHINELGKTNEIVQESSDEPKQSTVLTINNETETIRAEVSPNSTEHLNEKLKPIDKLKHKMLNILHKRVPDNHIAKDSRICRVKMDAMESPNKPTAQTLKELPNLKKYGRPIQFLSGSHNGVKYPWAKAKWASDFIENIIKKIKNGVYFSPDQNTARRITEISMQTNAVSDEDDVNSEKCFSPKVTISRKKDTAKIPGFDSSLLGLEIKTLNMKQIAVRHCTTNVMIKFDVAVPTTTNEIKICPNKPALIFPVEVTSSHTQVLKCNTTILNEMLPAELCSIIPRMIKLIEPTIKSFVRPHCIILDKTISNLSTLTEASCNQIAIKDSLLPTGTPVETLSPIMRVLEGVFSKTPIRNSAFVIPPTSFIRYDDNFVINLLPNVSFHSIITLLPRTIKTAYIKHVDNKTANLTENVEHTPNRCEEKCATSNTITTLEVYTTNNKRLIPAFQKYDFTTFIRSIMNTPGSVQIRQNCKTTRLYVNLSIQNFTCIYQFSKDLNIRNHDETAVVEDVKRSAEDNINEQIHRTNEYQNASSRLKVLNRRIKGNTFHKLYRKCKSTSNILPCKGKYMNTPLDKVQCIDDFFQILGPNVLSNVFDGPVAKKIMSSISEMKNWIKYINPTQALLILLLICKKDTPNLTRYRPVLLQGIAVNRITKATELDMEIEVIERENLNKFVQHDGLSYFSASVENYDQLLEELYWIAKTTASDYQLPFDETSEKLLKSLLERRKKLNPSYLRVMARYVGLGLLKAPIKK